MEQTLIRLWEEQKVVLIALAVALVALLSCVTVVGEQEQATGLVNVSTRDHVVHGRCRLWGGGRLAQARGAVLGGRARGGRPMQEPLRRRLAKRTRRALRRASCRFRAAVAGSS